MIHSHKNIKRYRSAFTTEQVKYLEEKFKKFPYIPNSQRKEAAIALNISERAVKIWFQNRRMKEKRENVSKAFGEEVTEHTSIELAKDQLNNVIPSANDEQSQSLSLLTNIDNVSSNKNGRTNYCSSNLNTQQNTIQNKIVSEDLTTVNKKGSSPTFVTKHLCKNHKMKDFNPVDNTPVVSDIKHVDFKQDIENKPIPRQKVVEQTIPEDLSKRKVMASTTNPSLGPSAAISNAGCVNQSMSPSVSPFYSDPYYSTTSVFWKPVSVVPSVTTSGALVSVHIPNSVTNIPIVQQNESKKCCKCDCNVEPLLCYNFQQQSPSPQYIITSLPFLSNPNPTKL